MSAGSLPIKFRYVPLRQVPSARRSSYASATEIAGDMIGDDLILGHLAHGSAGRYKATAAEIMNEEVDGLFRRHVNTRIRGHHRDRYWTTQEIDDAVADPPDPDTTAPVLSALFLNVISETEANVAFTTATYAMQSCLPAALITTTGCTDRVPTSDAPSRPY